jgi:hypothetical protein
MNMTVDDYRTLIDEIKRDVLPAYAPIIRMVDPMRVTLADAYEIRNLDKTAIKNLREDEVLALIAYGKGYIKQYREGKFLYKKGNVNNQGCVSLTPGRMLLADFDEAEAYDDIKLSIRLLDNELKHKI